ncbi:MAG: hypothetical protein LC648_06605 [Novosphingobium sp.]|nr:hypothetical protein [Novosphingobium sp.]
MLALAPLLGGCVAVAALPVLASGAMFAGGNVKIRAATPRPKVAQPPRVAAERTAGAPAGAEAAAGAGIVLTNLTALPPPGPVRSAAADPWRRFVAWALDRAPAAAGRAPRRSVLYEPGSSLALPRMRECRAETPAVVIDLDREGAPFAPAAAPADPALAADLARLREAGIVVLWLTALPADRVGEVAEALRASGLDPEGRDPLLLARNPDDRKQTLREDANRDVCVIAIAGDRKGDFDELFDYLRDPAAAVSLDSFLGAGWFLVPPPLG